MNSTQHIESSSSQNNDDHSRRATLHEKIQVLNHHHTNSSTQQETVLHFQTHSFFKITKSSFNRWLKTESQLRQTYESLAPHARLQYKTLPSFKNATMDRCLEKWYEQKLWHSDGVISERSIICQWRLFGAMLGETDSKTVSGGSNGWVYHFKKRMRYRHDLILKFREGKIDLMMGTDYKEDRKRVKGEVKGFEKRDVYCYDECVMNARISGSSGGGIGNNNALWIVGVLMNADGSDIVDPLVVNCSGQRKNTNKMNTSMSRHYENVFNNDIFQQYLTKWDGTLGNRRVCLLMDCLHEHVVDESMFPHIKFVWFNPKSQTKYSMLNKDYPIMQEFEEFQPLNLGIVKILKIIFRRKCYQHYVNGVITQNKLIQLSEEQVYQIIKDSYDEMKAGQKNFVNQCFKHLFEENFDLIKHHVDKHLENGLIKIVDEFSKIYGINHDAIVEHIIFPRDEVMMNRTYSDSEIVALVKLEERGAIAEKDKANEMESKDSVDLRDLARIERVVNIELKEFLEKNHTRFGKSHEQFIRFVNEFIGESMDVRLEG